MNQEEFEKYIDFTIEYEFTQIKNQYLNPEIIRNTFKTEKEFQEYVEKLHSKTLDEIHNEIYCRHYGYDDEESCNKCFD